MALNGTYKVILKSPMGNQEGSFTFETIGNVLTGTAIAQGTTVALQNGVINGSDFEFIMEMKVAFKMKVTVNGTVDGDNIAGTVKTAMGTMAFEGSKVT